MTRTIARSLAGAALWAGLAGVAGAVTPLTTSPFDIDHQSLTMFCDARNIGTQSVQFRLEFVDYNGVVRLSVGPNTLTPGSGTAFPAPANMHVGYCRFTPIGGSPKSLRAGMYLTINGKYLASADAH